MISQIPLSDNIPQPQIHLFIVGRQKAQTPSQLNVCPTHPEQPGHLSGRLNTQSSVFTCSFSPKYGQAREKSESSNTMLVLTSSIFNRQLLPIYASREWTLDRDPASTKFAIVCPSSNVWNKQCPHPALDTPLKSQQPMPVRGNILEKNMKEDRGSASPFCAKDFRFNVIMISRRLHHINLRMRTSIFFMKRWESRVTVQGENHLYQNCWMHKWIDWHREWHILPFSKIVDKSLQMCCLQCQIHLTTVDYHQFIICIEESINKRILNHLSRWKL